MVSNVGFPVILNVGSHMILNVDICMTTNVAVKWVRMSHSYDYEYHGYMTTNVASYMSTNVAVDYECPIKVMITKVAVI